MKTIENMVILIDGYLKAIESNPYGDTVFFRSYGEILSKLSYALTHLETHRMAIMDSKNYVPKHEVEMILSVLDSLPALQKIPKTTAGYDKYSVYIAQKEENIKQFLLSLKNYLFNLGTLMIERMEQTKKHTLKSRIVSGLQQIDSYLLEQLQYKELKTDDQHDELKAFIQFLESDEFESNLYVKSIKRFLTEESSESKLNERLCGEDSFWLDVFKAVFGIKNQSHFLKFIQWFQNQHADKKEFAKFCIKIFHQAYAFFEKNYDDALYVSDFLLALLAILTQPLKTGELYNIIKEYDETMKTDTLTPISYNIWDYVGMTYGELKPDSGDIYYKIEKMQEECFLPLFSFPVIHHSLKAVEKQITFPQEVKNIELMEMALTGCSTDVIQAFNKLVTKFVKINDNAPRHQQRNCALFFHKHRLAIRQLINLLGEKSIREMEKMIAVSVLTLERTLLSVPGINVALIERLSEYFKKHSPNLTLTIHCLTALNSLIKLKVHENNNNDDDSDNDSDNDNKPILTDFYMKIANGSPTVECFLRELANLLLKHVFKESDFKISTDQTSQMFERVPVSEFVQLIAASNTMDSDQYQDIFLNMLKLDLLGGNINQFLHDPLPANPAGKLLALHNQAIRNKLKDSKICPQMVLSYKKTYDFIVYPAENADLNFQRPYLVLWTYLKQLQEAITHDLTTNTQLISHEVKRSVAKVSEQIADLGKQINKNGEKKGAENINKIIKTISKQLTGQLRCIENICQFHTRTPLDKRKLSKDFYEFANHVLDQLTLIKKNNPTNLLKELKSASDPDCFTVKLWDKANPRTFFLGNEVGCCLAAGNDRFSAMVQRRMDDAMIFPVVIDRRTNRVVALVWAYLAKTKEDQIILMANFFEVNAKYGTQEHSRKAILNGLLQFISQYLQDTGIQSFYMNQLEYGHNIGDLNDYPVEPLALQDKVGGPFIPEDIETQSLSEERGKELTDKYYYLVSLRRDRFHKFSQDILTSKMSLSSKTVKQLIESELSQSTCGSKEKSETNIHQATREIIEKHPLELKPFFDQPLSENPLYRELTHTQEVLEEKSTEEAFEQKPTPSVPPLLSFGAGLFAKTTTPENKSVNVTPAFKCIIL